MFGECNGLGGAPLGICFAYCEALDCDESDPRFGFVCRVLHRLYERVTGGETLPCEAPPVQTLSCDDMDGRAGQMCERICDRCATRLFPSSCDRLARHFTRMTGVELPCSAS